MDEVYEVHEGPLGLIQVTRTDAHTLSTAIKDVLMRCMLPLSQCRGQAYDRASNMSGRLNGVAAQITSEQPSALHVHDMVQEMYSKDFDMLRLSTHLNMLPDIVKQYNAISVTPLKKVTTVQTVCSMMNEVPGAKSLCSELDRTLKLLTIPVTTATSERTLSVMRRLKTYLRSSMTQERLNNVLILHCYKSRTDVIDVI